MYMRVGSMLHLCHKVMAGGSVDLDIIWISAYFYVMVWWYASNVLAV